MGDTVSDEHLRIFKCLIDTGSLVLRNAIQINVLNKNSIEFDQYLETNKHQFYHQFEKNTRRKCCDGNPHGCIVYGFMDKNIFNKFYNKKTETNTRDCLDRFEIKADISLDILDLSDLNFLLWNSRTLKAKEENSLQKIMSIRSAICHSSSSHFYSKVEMEGYWSDLKSAVLLLAKPKFFKDSVEKHIESFQNCKLNALKSGKVVRAISQNCTRNANRVATKVTKFGNKLEENQKKDGRRIRNCIKQTVKELQKEGIKTRRQSARIQNTLDKRLKGNRKKVCQKLDINKRCLNKISKQVNEESSKSSKRFESMSKQIAELEKTMLNLLTKSSDDDKLIEKLEEAIDDHVKKEARERRRHHDKSFTDVQEDANTTSKCDQTLSNRLKKIAILKKVAENLDKANDKITMLTRGKEMAATVVLCGAISGGYTMFLVGGVTTIGLIFWKSFFEGYALDKAHESMKQAEMNTSILKADVNLLASEGSSTEPHFVLKILKKIPNDILTFQYTITDLLKSLFISESVSIQFAKEQISKLREKLENQVEQMQKREQKALRSRHIRKRKYAVDK